MPTYVGSSAYADLRFKDPTGAYTHLLLRITSPYGGVEILSGSGVVLQTAPGAMSFNGTWQVLEVAILIHGTQGHIFVYKDYDYANPIISYVGDTYYSGDLSIGEISMYILPGSAIDDVKAQCSSVSYSKGFAYSSYPTTANLISVYDGSGLAATTTLYMTAAAPTSLTVLIGSSTLTGVVTGVVSGADTFDISSGVSSTIAISIAAAINDPNNSFTSIVTAVASGNNVILSAVVAGTGRNSTAFTVTAVPAGNAYGYPFAAGTNGVLLGSFYLYGSLPISSGSGRVFARSIQTAALTLWDGFKEHDPLVGGYVLSSAGWSANFAIPGQGLDPDSGMVGDGYFQTALLPNGAGSRTELTPTGGANFANVNTSVSPTADATLNTGLAAGAGDLYAMQNSTLLQSDIATIKQVMVYARGLKDNAVLNNARMLVKSGGVSAKSSLVPLPSTFGVVSEKFLLNPATGLAWTVAEINAMEAGIEIES